MALLTRVEPGITGADPGFVTPTASTGDTFPVDDDTIFHVVNGSGGSINVTITSTANDEPGITAADLVVAVPDSEERAIRLKPSARFRDGSGLATAVCSSVSSVTVAVTRVA